jgi:TolB-like protein/Tfp pilus assembly protein PilF
MRVATGIALSLALTAGGAWYFLPGIWTGQIASNALPPPAAQRFSIVVLPFANLSGDPAQDYLADALTDELTTGIARSIRESFVIARNTAFTYKGKPDDAKAIGKALGVRYVLEGSVQPSGAQMRVNAQLIDAESGAHLWAEQFDTLRADLLQMQDEIVTHLARAMEIQLTYAEATRLKRPQAANPDAEDLALQCEAAVRKGGLIGKEADAGYRLCEQALDADPNSDRALGVLSTKYYLPVGYGISTDPKADLKRADDLASRAIALNPNLDGHHIAKALILLNQARYEESIAEGERALVLNPANVDAVGGVLGWDYLYLGQFEKSLEFFDKAIRLSPRDPAMAIWYDGKSVAHFGLKQYDQAIESARRAVVIDSMMIPDLAAPLALTGHEADARERLQRYFALPSSAQLRTIAAQKAANSHWLTANSDPRILVYFDRYYDGLRKAGMPEE